jgi:thioesterase domain-containing protein/aryl carrier-like protein
MYRTGDRGVRRADEEIEFHGRLDRQTKIRGQRVELDEIASALANHPSIEFATVTAEGPSGGESQIVGYFRCKTGTDIPSPIELQQFLARSLPGYMIPAVFVRLGALPLSPNGKIDLKMLPRHTERPLKEETAVELVASPVERKLLSIVRELLGNQTVAAGDSFFLAGGHSLLGMQLVIRVRQAFGVDLTLRQLFEAPTVHTLSSIVENTIEQQRLARIWARVLGREGVRLDDNFFELGGHALVGTLQRCIAEEFGRWIATADLSRNPTLRQQTELTRQRGRIESALPPGVYALQPNGTWDSIFWVHYPGVELARALGNDQPYFSVALTSEECVSLGQHPTLEKLATNLVDKILATQADGPYVIGGFCLGGVLAYEVACQLRRAGREISLLALVDAPNPSYMARCDSLKRMVDYICYATKRARRLGPRTTMRHFMDRLFKRSRLDNGLNIAPAGIRVQEICEAAMRAYHPIRYDGRMLLLVATEHAPHRNFLESWRAVVPDLDARYVDAHHRDLLTTRNARTIADIMLPYLKSGAGGNSSYRSGNTSGNRVA